MKYRIGTDDNSWTIEQRCKPNPKSKSKKGRDGWKAILWFTSAEHAAKALVERSARDEFPDGGSLSDLTETLERARREVAALLSPEKA